ncbi:MULTISPECIES: LysR family transcriptional regulator [unclassified Coleofasciculus]|uniref:LysR family transcriptional regulator n=1 Tax=unclassified Coleofasciculus TaxID=2692782 RepID=UPI001882CE2C|nr:MULTISPECIES: LysR family transcriptional regulator [unclassified Coleofasciculus]MBE9126519.1 LysR family transcriptional regulator [Coleofasciculus sp. LEGE 07081]MBE9149953.1 LysR family transcriptional regulator [Coleofasciculus sp. LEGE 07092]
MDAINPYKLKISQLRALVAVANHENFSEAALQLQLSQSAISHAIASLEEELGVVLLSRGRHGAHLTPVGERVLVQARQVLQLLDGIVKEANREKGLHGGQVRIATFRSVATHILPGVIARFINSLPDIAVTITEHSDYVGVEQALREGRADIGFIYLPASTEFETWEILRDEYVVLLPPNTQFSNDGLTWEQLAIYPLIFPPASNACHTRIHGHLRVSGHPLKAAYEVNEDSTIVSMVMQGLGAAILPRLAAEPLPKEIKVCSLPVPLERIIGAAIRTDTFQTPAVFAFLDALRNTGQFSTKATV